MNIQQLNLTLADIEAQLLRQLSEMSSEDGEDEMDGEDEGCDCEDPDECDCEEEYDDEEED
jgi:hypothetical protein